MSTRACLAKATADGHWEGVYVHSDGYPTYLGEAIWETLQKQFVSPSERRAWFDPPAPQSAVRAFCDVFISGHPSGWSSFPDVCYCHDPYFVIRDGVRDGSITSSDHCQPFVEWVYVIDPSGLKLTVLRVRFRKSPPFEPVADVDLLGPELDWGALESSTPSSLTQPNDHL